MLSYGNQGKFMKIVLEARSLYKKYREDSTEIVVLREVSLKVTEGEIVVIIGPSGSGKTTLLSILGGLLRPTAGEVLIDGESIFDYNDRQLASMRSRKIGFIFQFQHLLPEFTALENTAMPLWIAGKNNIERAENLLKLVSMDKRKTHLPSQLSGGEKQRVAVSRALVNDPQIVLADEPSGNLDMELSNSLHNLIKKVSQETGKAFVIVTQKESMKSIADRVLNLVGGRLEEG